MTTNRCLHYLLQLRVSPHHLPVHLAVHARGVQALVLQPLLALDHVPDRLEGHESRPVAVLHLVGHPLLQDVEFIKNVLGLDGIQFPRRGVKLLQILLGFLDPDVLAEAVDEQTHHAVQHLWRLGEKSLEHQGVDEVTPEDNDVDNQHCIDEDDNHDVGDEYD